MKNIMISRWQMPQYENRRHTGKDLVGIAIIVATAMIAANFIFQQTKIFNNGLAEQSFADILAAQRLQYQLNIAQSKSTPEKTYIELKQALLANDLDGVLKLIHPGYLWKYEEGLKKAAADNKLFQIAAQLTPFFAKIDEYGDTAVYSLKPLPGEKSVTDALKRHNDQVEFTRDYDGIWKISSL